MLTATSNTIVVEMVDKKAKLLGSDSFSKTNVNQQNIQSLNTIKINFNKMAKAKSKTQPFTQCQCGGIMIKEDEHEKLERDGQYFIWYCRFCKKQNKSKQVFFSENNSKFVLQKNIQRGFLPPLLLFLIDLSGSMGQSITAEYQNSGAKEQDLITVSKQLIQMIKKSNFYQKNCHKQKDIKQIYGYKCQEQQFKKTKIKGSQYFSKITFFMSVIENYLQKIKNQSEEFKEFRIGFIFFNQAIYLLKANKQKFIPVYVPHSNNFSKEFPFEKNNIDFNSYEQLFNAGQKSQRFFADSKIKNLDLSKLLVQYLDTQGQTAIGPALAFALGVTSAHDFGCRIVLISDAEPNIGILSEENEQNLDCYKKIQKIIIQKQMTIGILNWIKQQGKSYQQRIKTPFSKFLKENKEHIKQISLDFSLRLGHTDVLNTAKKTLESFIKRTIGQLLSINILTSNSKVDVTQFKYDDKNFKFIKFLGLDDKNWVQIKVKKLSEEDYLFPIYIQLIAVYEDVLTKQKNLYFSYTKQKIISSKADKEVYQYLDSGNKNNMRQLLYLQKIYNFDRQKIIAESISSRNLQNSSMEMKFNNQSNPINLIQFSSICSSLNSLAQLENKKNYDQEEEEYL